MSLRAIGIFDSGVGGLTVLKAIRQELPLESLVYLGDTARVPYGTKSPPTVERYALQAAAFLLAQQVKMVVVACNTASSVALPALQRALPVPVVGVIEPGAAGAVETSRSGRIGVIGTEATIASAAYPQAIRALRQDAEVYSAACPLFVPLAEEGWAEHVVARLTAQEYLAPLLQQRVDTLVLGCTHYPLLRRTLEAILPPEVRLVDSARQTALQVRRLLGPQTLAQRGDGSCRFFVTDEPTRFVRVGGAFLGEALTEVQRVELQCALDGSGAVLAQVAP
ncbi:MAG: glutamate racemase [Desulfuromonas thiophila]|nr:glutamate racemase [Desulfuromonas thiophila]